MRRIAFFIFAMMVSSAVSAQTPSEGDRQQIAGLSAMFDAAFEARDVPAITGFLPQPILDHIAIENDMEPAVMRRIFITQTEHLLEGVTVDNFVMDVDNLVPGRTPIGRAYALVPTSAELSLDGRQVQAESQTLFFEDDGAWFLLRLESRYQLDIVKAVYPDFASLTLP